MTHLHAREALGLEQSITTRIRDLRAALGLSAATFDRISGLSIGLTRRLEQGTARVYAHHLYRMAEATGVGIDYFYEDAFSLTPDLISPCAPNPDLAPAANPLQIEKQRLLQAYLKIRDPILKRDLFELVESLAAAPQSDLE